jgi:hypothetical protein
LGGRVQQLGDFRDKTAIPSHTGAYDDPLGRDFIFPDIIAIAAAPHFDDHEDFAELTVDLYITKPDNIIGEKRNREVAEEEMGKSRVYLHRA